MKNLRIQTINCQKVKGQKTRITTSHSPKDEFIRESDEILVSARIIYTKGKLKEKDFHKMSGKIMDFIMKLDKS